MKRLLFVAVFLAPIPASLHAQIATGNLYGSVADTSGAVLPGVSIQLKSEAGSRATVSDGAGAFRFLGLDRGLYTLTLELAGFTTLAREVRIVTGENVELALTLTVSGLEEVVSVTAETPLVETKRRGTSTTMTAEELSSIPTARDPWGVLRNVPGVLTDRVNIAGNESGQQGGIVGKGTDGYDRVWSLDGVVMTDMATFGGAASYFDFGALDEINVTTGGPDLKVATGGIGIHLTTKRGTNAFHGGARGFLAHDDLQSSNLPDELRGDPRLQGAEKADRIQQITELGFDLGGPILKDRLWFYASWGRQDIRIVDLTQLPDRTVLSGWNAKLNWQASPQTQVSGFWFRNEKEKYGRTGWSGVAADSYRFDQRGASTSGGLPPGLWKLQVDHTVSPNLFLSARAAHHDMGFGLYARGTQDQSFTRDYSTGEAIGTNYDYVTLRPDTTLGLDGNGFFEALGGHHELKFGLGYRKYSVSSLTSWAGNQVGGFIFGPGDTAARVLRDVALEYGGEYWHAYLGDTYSRGRLTLNAGLRWDGQGARNRPSAVAANAVFPDLLPGLDYPGNPEDLISWSDLRPRVGLSLALDEDRHTVVRASYAEYAQQLQLWEVLDENPMLGSFLAYAWDDLNGDRLPQANEVLLDQFLYSYNVDPSRPAEVADPVSFIDRDLKPKRDREVVLGIDREIVPNLAVGLAYTWRRTSRFPYWPWLGGPCAGEPTASSCPILTPEDFTPNPPVTANGYTAFTYSPDPALLAAGGYGWIATAQPGYSRHYSGLELTLTKRLSGGWMGRLAFSWNDWTDHFEGTPVGAFPAPNPTSTRYGPLIDGGQVAGVGKNDIFTSVKWQLYANAMVQLPWRVELSGAVFGRQGHPYPKFLRLRAGLDGNLQALAQPRVDEDRYEKVWDLDLRLAKQVRLGRAGLTLSAELFNVFNSGVVLLRDGNARAASFDRINEILSPRILRLGARLTF